MGFDILAYNLAVLENLIRKHGEGHADVIEVLLSSAEFPLVVPADKMHLHIIVKQSAEFIDIGGINTAKVGVLDLLDGLDIHEALNVAAQILDAVTGYLQRYACADAESFLVQFLPLLAHIKAPFVACVPAGTECSLYPKKRLPMPAR